MPATYELWLTDDAGVKIVQLRNISFFSYSRSQIGISTLEVGLPYEIMKSLVYPVFKVDRRIEAWRSAEAGVPMRREGSYLIRKQRIYTRLTDNVTIIVFYANNGWDFLNRRTVIQPAGSAAAAKSGSIDDVMKQIVREQSVWGSTLDVNGDPDNNHERSFPEGEFTCEADLSFGPTTSVQFADRRVLDILKDLKNLSFQLNALDPLLYRKIYFDVVPIDLGERIDYILDETGEPILDETGQPLLDETSTSVVKPGATGFQFITVPDLYGIDRTSGLIFSVENNNITSPEYSESHIDAVNTIVVKGYGRGDSRPSDTAQDPDRANASRWNRVEEYLDASREPDQSNLADYGYAKLYLEKPIETLDCTFLNIGASENTPRSLYGIDWDLGDLLPVSYLGRIFEVEVSIVYVSMDENGDETVTGQTDVNSGGSDAVA